MVKNIDSATFHLRPGVQLARRFTYAFLRWCNEGVTVCDDCGDRHALFCRCSESMFCQRGTARVEWGVVTLFRKATAHPDI